MDGFPSPKKKKHCSKDSPAPSPARCVVEDATDPPDTSPPIPLREGFRLGLIIEEGGTPIIAAAGDAAPIITPSPGADVDMPDASDDDEGDVDDDEDDAEEDDDGEESVGVPLTAKAIERAAKKAEQRRKNSE